MKMVLASLALLVAAAAAHAQIPVTPNPDHEAMLHHSDPQLAKNKRLVYDFWREVFEAAHMDLAPKYMAETYIQHNPRVPTGRQAFIDFFSKVRTPAPIEPRVKAPLVAILADGDLVTMVFVREYPEPGDSSRKYTTTWFDMFRIVDGKIAEHWDPATKS
ncbi:MAG TPA: nuclear transport factor 2 family protein [Candidatus Methylomirabilis sp.]|nr:nuclear transport factor 2 family protein [Candidatus Methylomirabilis sp.]